MSEIGELEQELNLTWRNLQNDWMQVREVWRDKVAEDFEREWWDELEYEIPQLIESISQLDEAFRQAEMFLET